MIPNYLTNLPEFAAFFAMGLLLLGVFWSLYTLVTPRVAVDSHGKCQRCRDAGRCDARFRVAGGCGNGQE